MGSLFSYSALTTKIKAMQSNLITNNTYASVSELNSVSEFVSLLKSTNSYSKIFNNVDEQKLHRGDIEKLLINSLYTDFSKIYRFANFNQRKFLDIAFIKYEIAILKMCFKSVFDKTPFTEDLSIFKTFFSNHSKLNIDILSNCTTTEELLSHLKKTNYYEYLVFPEESHDLTLFDYEMRLDKFYFCTIWKCKDTLLEGDDLKAFTKIVGTRIDLVNAQWIYRSIKYYGLSSADIYSLLIPIHYKLKKGDTISLVESENELQFLENFKKSYYGRYYSKMDDLDLEEFYITYLDELNTSESSRHPYSLIMVINYLHHKEHEIKKLTLALECVRYRLPASETIKYIMKR